MTSTPTPTVTVTTSPGYCTGCTSYNVVIAQSDLDLSDDGIVYLTYPDCENNNNIIQNTYNYSGTYLNDVCIDNCGVTPVICIVYSGNSCYTNISSYIQATDSCTPIIESCGTCFDLTISDKGYTIYDSIVELGQSYGNLEVTISVTNASSIFEVFVGNAEQNIGEVFQYTSSNQSITKTVGFISYNSTTKLDIRVFASTTSTVLSPVNINVCVSCPTLHLCDEPNFSQITSDLYATSSQACNSIYFNPDPTEGNGTTFCNSTTFYNPSFGTYTTGTYNISFNGQYRGVTVINGNDTVTATTACQNCTTLTPTPTVTQTPTITPSNTATPTVTPTEGEIPSPTATPTPTKTPAPTCNYYYLGSNTFSTTYEYVDCTTGNTIQVFVGANSTFGPVCSRTTPTGGRILNQGQCP